MRSKTRTIELYFELSEGVSLGDFLRQVRDLGFDVGDVQRERDSETESNVRAYVAVMKAPKRQKHLEILEQLQKIPGVVYLDEL